MLDIVLNILRPGLALVPGARRAAADAEWGLMVADGQTFLLTAWWISTLPGFVIVLAGVGFSLIGDGLADRLRQGWRGRAGENEGMILTVAEDGMTGAAEPQRAARGARTCASRSRPRTAPLLAAAGVSFSVGEGETSGIVGESGSGKSVTLRSLLGLVPEPGRVIDGEVCGTAGTCSRPRKSELPRDPRPRDLDDLPGPDEQPEPRLHDRRADRRDAAR